MVSVKETGLERNAEGVDKEQNISPPYTFHIGASWAAKSETNAWTFKHRSPFPSDTDIGSWRNQILSTRGSNNRKGDPGEDFFFIQQKRNRSGISVGVADGVTGWADRKIDPSLFSQALMYYASHIWAGEPKINPSMNHDEHEQLIKVQDMSPYECLDLAYNSVLRDEQIKIGSSTACIISLDASSGVLRSANLGDSGYLIIRSNSIFYTSLPQTHQFRCPKQLTKVTAELEGLHYQDPPSDAETNEMELHDGDIVIVYTDGLSDNVFPSEIITTICSRVAREGETEDEQVQSMADDLVDYAKRCMRNDQKTTPIEGEAKKQGMWYFRGGKPDDVTVIVGLVHKTSEIL